MDRNTLTIKTTAPLHYFLITVKVITLEKKCDTQNHFLVIYKIRKLFVNTLSADDRHYVLNRHHLTPPIHMQLSQKLKVFPEFFFSFSKSILNFKHFPKKDDPHS